MDTEWKEKEWARVLRSCLQGRACRGSNSATRLQDCEQAHRRRELRGFGGARPDAGDGDDLSLASQDAGLTLCHRPLPAIRLHADAEPCFLALRGGSADTFAALGWKKRRERLGGPWWTRGRQGASRPKS